MSCKKTTKGGIALRYFLFAVFLLFTIFPIYWIVSCSFRETAELQRTAISVVQQTFTWSHYQDAFETAGLLHCLRNSLIITFGTVAVTIPLGLMSAYAFAKLRFRGKRSLHSLIMLTQFIPVVAYVVPLYLMMSKLHLLNTIYCLWITYLAIAYPMAAILLVGYIQDIPDSLEEAALIDGCSTTQAMFRIVFPLEEDELFRLMEIVMRYMRCCLDHWLKMDIDAVAFGDNWGARSSLLIPIRIWRRLFKPLYRELIGQIHAAGKKVFFHSSGYIWDLYPELIELGADAVSSDLWRVGIEKIAAHFAGEITFWGKINCRWTLPFGTPEDIYAEAASMKRHLFCGGGLIGQSEVGGNIPPANTEAALAAWNR